MAYNIHPILVHFPIALLVLYSLVKIIPWGRWFPSVAWKQIERILLVVGVIGAFFALATGETAEHLVRPQHDLVEMHSFFATLATWLYAALLVGEILAFFKKLPFIQKILCNVWLSGIVAIIALISISLAGLLGGVIVYGTTADPFANSVLKVLNIQVGTTTQNTR